MTTKAKVIEVDGERGIFIPEQECYNVSSAILQTLASLHTLEATNTATASFLAHLREVDRVFDGLIGFNRQRAETEEKVGTLRTEVITPEAFYNRAPNGLYFVSNSDVKKQA